MNRQNLRFFRPLNSNVERQVPVLPEIGANALKMEGEILNFTNGFAFETDAGIHLGFVLGAPSFKVADGDCVFMLAPVPVEGVETPLGQLVSELKVRGEHRWANQDGNIVVLNSSAPVLTILSSGSVLNADGIEVGKAIPLPESK